MINPDYRRIYWFGALIFIVTAWFSTGYNHFDEHFQVIEFAGLKLGLNAASDLPWEYGYRMRPALQPFLVFLLYRSVAFFGLTDPFIIAFLVRLFSVSIAFISIHLSLRLFAPEFRDRRILAALFLLSFFTWFIPYNAARFSSETLSGRLFLIGIALFFLRDRSQARAYLVAGLLLGTAFVVRYQTAFMAIGFMAWLLIRDRSTLRQTATFCTGFAGAIGAGIIADRWFYGEWVFTAWNYFEQNLVAGKAAHFGVSPWWYYLEQTLVNALPPLSLLMIAGVILYFIFFPKDWLTWIFLPFLLAHFAIGHKEIRFLFPIIGFLPFMVVRTADRLLRRDDYRMLDKPWLRYSAKGAWYLNLVMLAILLFRPADDAISLYRHLWKSYEKPARLCYTDDNPYHRAKVDIHFYKRSGLALVHFDSLEQVLPTADSVTLFVTKRPGPPPNPHYAAVEIYRTYPLWVRHFNVNHWLERTSFWHVYEMKPVSSPEP